MNCTDAITKHPNIETEDIPSENLASRVRVLSVRKCMFVQQDNKPTVIRTTNKSLSTARSSLFIQKPVFHYTDRLDRGDADSFNRKRRLRNPSICIPTLDNVSKVVKTVKFNDEMTGAMSSRKVSSYLASPLYSIKGLQTSRLQYTDPKKVTKTKSKADRVTLGSLMKRDSDIDIGCSYALSQYISPRIGENPSLKWTNSRHHSSQAVRLS